MESVILFLVFLQICFGFTINSAKSMMYIIVYRFEELLLENSKLIQSCQSVEASTDAMPLCDQPQQSFDPGANKICSVCLEMLDPRTGVVRFDCGHLSCLSCVVSSIRTIRANLLDKSKQDGPFDHFQPIRCFVGQGCGGVLMDDEIKVFQKQLQEESSGKIPAQSEVFSRTEEQNSLFKAPGPSERLGDEERFDFVLCMLYG